MTVTKYVGQYKCKWPGCGIEFKANFGKYEVEGRGRQNGISAVKCPQCGNNLKPVIDAISIQEIKTKE